ncbi:MAG: hypothetical protein ACYSWO_30605, partial [Planctomycetota bacterium]
LGLGFLLRTLDRLVLVQEETESPKPSDNEAEKTETESTDSGPKGALDRAGKQTTEKARNVFRVWTTVFALVGAQMSWVLRPLIGAPTAPFEWFRDRESNFFVAVVRALAELFSL